MDLQVIGESLQRTENAAADCLAICSVGGYEYARVEMYYTTGCIAGQCVQNDLKYILYSRYR